MAGRASEAGGNVAGRYNLRPPGRRGQGGLRGAEALADFIEDLHRQLHRRSETQR